MATKKERIKNLEASFYVLQDSFNIMESRVHDKLLQLEFSISKVFDILLTRTDPSSNISKECNGSFNDHFHEVIEIEKPLFSTLLAKLEFPKYIDEDPMEWLNHVDQFFEYQGTLEVQKVFLASFHLEGEANQWCQWLYKAYHEEGEEVSWNIFVEELWSHFGPINYEDFDEALSKIRQSRSLQDYQKEFERLDNKMQ